MFSITTSCSHYSYVFASTEKYTSEKASKSLLKYIDEDELYITFTELYSNFDIKIYENDTLYINESITTGNKVKGIANSYKVNKNANITIFLDGYDKPIKINQKQMKLYKFIFVSKFKEKIKIEFDNAPRAFVNFPKNNYIKKDSIP